MTEKKDTRGTDLKDEGAEPEAETEAKEGAEAKTDVNGAEMDERTGEAEPKAEVEISKAAEADTPEEAGTEVKAEESEPTEEAETAEESQEVQEEAAESSEEPDVAVEAREEIEVLEPEPEETTTAHAAADAPKKGLMQRRKSFLQTSVPNAHRGYNPKTPRIMLGIIAIFIIASFILAAISG